MALNLTPREKDLYHMLQEFVNAKGYPPSVREIGEKMGWASSSTVHLYLERLEKKGYIRKDPSKPRTIEIIGQRPDFTSIPLIGTVSAGNPLLAVECIEEYLPIAKTFIGEGEFFALRVQGDSMIEAGIFNGDLVIVRQQQDALNSEIVVALLEDEVTVKRFFKEKDQVRLQPENSALAPIYCRDMTILGKVVTVIRRLN
ncbi:transcriptional repressor LexA [Heliorestis acidaminivorans]|uniref:LexA repressor n=1 Tax=Heliorestis acidaminivorans TaxID=553427 RepID=A0A6I0EZG6_9FIRM|nr:transcriptional repressor LexA [Heliorestis acidaminivorans]KAB2951289.1 transcriptional repressor LexA [Heliorestis acidaminivorans]